MSWDKEAWREQCRLNARSLESEINRLQIDYSDPLGFWHGMTSSGRTRD